MDIPFPLPHEISKDRPDTWKPYLPIKVVFVIGAPGAGKGTICEQAAQKLGYFHVSTGDCLRDLANRPGEHSKEAYAGLSPDALTQVMRGSGLITSEEIVEILRFKLGKEYQSGTKKFIIDGFPRNLESARAYEKLVRLSNFQLRRLLLTFAICSSRDHRQSSWLTVRKKLLLLAS